MEFSAFLLWEIQCNSEILETLMNKISRFSTLCYAKIYTFGLNLVVQCPCFTFIWKVIENRKFGNLSIGKVATLASQMSKMHGVGEFHCFATPNPFFLCLCKMKYLLGFPNASS